MLDILDKVFKSAILNIFKEVKEAMSEELKENIRTISCQIDNINKEIEIIEKNQVGILELNNIVMEMKNALEEPIIDLNWNKRELANLKTSQ